MNQTTEMMLAENMPANPEWVCCADDEDWLALRSTGIGASESAAACGVSDWATPLEIYLRKRGEIPPVVENDAMKMGNLLEPVVARLFVDAGNSLELYSPGLFRSKRWPHMLSTPDGIVDRLALAEFKTMNDRRAEKELGAEGTDEIPWDWICQAQQQMAVTGCEIVFFGVLIGGVQFRQFEVERNDNAINRIAEKTQVLWQQIQEGTPPSFPDGHKSSMDLIKEMFPGIRDGKQIELSYEASGRWEEYERLSKKAAELKKAADLEKAAVFHELADYEAGQLKDGRWLRRKLIKKKPQAATQYIDTRAVKKWP